MGRHVRRVVEGAASGALPACHSGCAVGAHEEHAQRVVGRLLLDEAVVGAVHVEQQARERWKARVECKAESSATYLPSGEQSISSRIYKHNTSKSEKLRKRRWRSKEALNSRQAEHQRQVLEHRDSDSLCASTNAISLPTPVASR